MPTRCVHLCNHLGMHFPHHQRWVKWASLNLSSSSCNNSFGQQCVMEVNYCTTKRTSTMWNTSAGYWAIAYCVIHAKRAAAGTHDACVLKTPVGPVTSTCVSQCRSSFACLCVCDQFYACDLRRQVANCGADDASRFFMVKNEQDLWDWVLNRLLWHQVQMDGYYKSVQGESRLQQDS